MLKHFIIVTLTMLGFYMVFMYIWQRHVMYFPAHMTPQRERYQAQDMQEIMLNTEDGLALMSWYKKAQDGKPTILYLHGNAGHLGYRMPLVRRFLDQGLGVLLLEYRGYSNNPGSPTEQGLYRDGRAGMHFLLETVGVQRVVLFGESLGSGIATQLATEFSVCAVVLQSPYTSFIDLKRYHYPLILAHMLDRYDSLSRIKNIKAPLLIVHGSADKLVPFRQGVRLFNEANEPKQFLELNTGHSNVGQDPTFVPTVLDFINSYCKEGSSL